MINLDLSFKAIFYTDTERGTLTLADAILDRLTANAQRIELKVESLRRKKPTNNQ